MARNLQLLGYAQWIALAVAHLAGTGAAVVLLLRRKALPATLAAVAFGLLFLGDLGQVARLAFLDNAVRGAGLPNAALIGNCCCSVVELIAVVGLVVAIWQAISSPPGTAPATPAASDEEGEVWEIA